MPTPPETACAPLRAKAGKYLILRLGRETYGLEVLKVREIVRWMDITAVPQMPEFIKGVINLRGKIVPVVDLRSKFGMPQADVTEQTCIVVLQGIQPSGAKSDIGVIVDTVAEVAQIQPGDIENVPNFGSQLNAPYLLGMARVRGTVTALLDIDQILSSNFEGTASGPAA
jgi:purine-binding chemotaxis protein CheW